MSEGVGHKQEGISRFAIMQDWLVARMLITIVVFLVALARPVWPRLVLGIVGATIGYRVPPVSSNYIPLLTVLGVGAEFADMPWWSGIAFGLALHSYIDREEVVTGCTVEEVD